MGSVPPWKITSGHRFPKITGTDLPREAMEPLGRFVWHSIKYTFMTKKSNKKTFSHCQDPPQQNVLDPSMNLFRLCDYVRLN